MEREICGGDKLLAFDVSHILSCVVCCHFGLLLRPRSVGSESPATRLYERGRGKRLS